MIKVGIINKVFGGSSIKAGLSEKQAKELRDLLDNPKVQAALKKARDEEDEKAKNDPKLRALIAKYRGQPTTINR